MGAVQTTLPSGTVTFLFTDIEGSTRLLQELGDRYGDIVRDHRRLVRETFGEHDGREVDTQGDAFFYSFTRARDAVAAAVAAQRALGEHAWPDGAQVRVRMGLHTGEPTVGEEGYLGLDVVRAARICSAGHGGQILMSETTRALLGNDVPAGASVVDLGKQNLKDVQHERIFQLSLDRTDESFPPLKTYPHEDSPDALADKFERRVNEYVAQALDNALTSGPPTGPSGLMKVGLAGIGLLIAFVAAIVVIVLLVKLAF
jgi:class 3 adenylate cyclase